MIIKCKGWDTVRKRMYSAEELGVDQEALLPDGRGFANISSDSIRLTQVHSHIMPLLFANIQDKNHKDIYEADIVKVWQYKTDYWDKTDMIEPTQPQQVRFIYANLLFPHWALCDLYLEGLQYVGGFDKLEVIGNIYENPELIIKEKTDV